MESFAEYPIIDNTTGVVGDMRVELVEYSILRFAPNGEPDRATIIDQLKQPDAELFLEFAAIRNEALKAWRKQHGYVQKIDEAELMRLEHQGIVDFARKHGPLFGFAGLSNTEPVIEEPLQDWIDAQKVMETTLLLNIFVEGGDVHVDEVEGYFPIVVYWGPKQLIWDYQYVPGVNPAGLYANALNDDFIQWFTTDDDTTHAGVWEKNTADVGMRATFRTVQGEMAGDDYLMCPQVAVPIQEALAQRELRDELPSLLKVVAQAHCKGMHLGFRNLFSLGSKNEGGYQVLCDSMLAYMWNQLALTYSRRAFRRCANPRCDNIIAENITTGVAKEYCCDACRAQVNNGKLTAQCRRGRESFYVGNDFLTIYRDAFGEDASSNDPDCRKKIERLKRWIEKDYSKTKKGKIALAKGAGRVPQRK